MVLWWWGCRSCRFESRFWLPGVNKRDASEQFRQGYVSETTLTCIIILLFTLQEIGLILFVDIGYKMYI